METEWNANNSYERPEVSRSSIEFDANLELKGPFGPMSLSARESKFSLYYSPEVTRAQFLRSLVFFQKFRPFLELPWLPVDGQVVFRGKEVAEIYRNSLKVNYFNLIIALLAR